MPRKLRVQYPGAMYHLMNRGDSREAIFRDDLDRQRFLATLAEAWGKTTFGKELDCRSVHAVSLDANSSGFDQ